jgi:hypothetical protein
MERFILIESGRFTIGHCYEIYDRGAGYKPGDSLPVGADKPLAKFEPGQLLEARKLHAVLTDLETDAAKVR